MPNLIEGSPGAPAASSRFAIVAAKFNREIVDKLVDGAIAGLKQHGVKDDAIDLVRVPGSFEIPLVCQKLAESGKYAAVIALGAVIRGDTDHYDYVCQAATDGVLQASLKTSVPVIFGILTCQTEELALARAGGSEGNKGFDAAVAALEMADLLRKIEKLR
jgi:6,7-dimethyl-8-ribityllumazine synthase